MTVNRILEEVMMLPGDIVLSPFAWRVDNPKQTNPMLQMLASIGWVEGVLVNKRTNRLIDGQKRVILARQRDPSTPIPVSLVDLSEEEEALILASLDVITDQAMPDADKAEALLGMVVDDMRGPLAQLWHDTGMESLLLDADMQSVSFVPSPEGEEDEGFDPPEKKPKRDHLDEDLKTATITVTFGPGLNIAVTKEAFLAWRATVYEEISFKEKEILAGLRRRLGFEELVL